MTNAYFLTNALISVLVDTNTAGTEVGMVQISNTGIMMGVAAILGMIAVVGLTVWFFRSKKSQ